MLSAAALSFLAGNADESHSQAVSSLVSAYECGAQAVSKCVRAIVKLR